MENEGRVDPYQMTGSVINLAAALALLDGDRELFDELVSVFLQECPSQLASVRDAIERQDPNSVRRAAHLLKGSVGAFGANPAADIAARMEKRGLEQDLAGAAADLPKLERALECLQDGLCQFQ